MAVIIESSFCISYIKNISPHFFRYFLISDCIVGYHSISFISHTGLRKYSTVYLIRQNFLPLVQQKAFLLCSTHTKHSFGCIRFPDVQQILTSVLWFDTFQKNTLSQSHNGKSGPSDLIYKIIIKNFKVIQRYNFEPQTSFFDRQGQFNAIQMGGRFRGSSNVKVE